MKFPLTASLVTAVSLLAAGVAGAQSYAQGYAQGGYGAPPKPRVACAADRQRLCASAQPGKAANRCLRKEISQASPQCQASVQAAKATRAERHAQAGSTPRYGGASQSGGASQYGGPSQYGADPQYGGGAPQYDAMPPQ